MHEKSHRNDIYGDQKSPPQTAIPAATVVLVRDVPSASNKQAVEVLMLQKNQNISFGGMWVFPGGRIDPEDYSLEQTGDSTDLAIAARVAAKRETAEETGLDIDIDSFVSFAHWTPPAATPKRYATWFFVAPSPLVDHVVVDGQEITNHRWINPNDALQLHAEGEIDLAPPTWITLYHINLYENTQAIIANFKQQADKIYATKIVKNGAGTRVALWHGDAAYETGEVGETGHRHRLTLAAGGFEFENTIETY